MNAFWIIDCAINQVSLKTTTPKYIYYMYAYIYLVNNWALWTVCEPGNLTNFFKGAGDTMCPCLSKQCDDHSRVPVSGMRNSGSSALDWFLEHLLHF